MFNDTQKGRKVNFQTSRPDDTTLAMALLGRTAGAISAHTGLSVNQVRYRVRQKLNLKLRDQRNASPQSDRILEHLQHAAFFKQMKKRVLDANNMVPDFTPSGGLK